MAKSKNSKILAMALCASVMAGIYASPVMAADTSIEAGDSSITVTDTGNNGKITVKADGTTIGTATKSAIVIGSTDKEQTITINGKYFTLSSSGALTAKGITSQGGNFYVKDASGNTKFTVTTTGAVTANNNITTQGGGLYVKSSDGKTTNFSVTNSGAVTANAVTAKGAIIGNNGITSKKTTTTGTAFTDASNARGLDKFNSAMNSLDAQKTVGNQAVYNSSLGYTDSKYSTINGQSINDFNSNRVWIGNNSNYDTAKQQEQSYSTSNATVTNNEKGLSVSSTKSTESVTVTESFEKESVEAEYASAQANGATKGNVNVNKNNGTTTYKVTYTDTDIKNSFSNTSDNGLSFSKTSTQKKAEYTQEIDLEKYYEDKANNNWNATEVKYTQTDTTNNMSQNNGAFSMSGTVQTNNFANQDDFTSGKYADGTKTSNSISGSNGSISLSASKDYVDYTDNIEAGKVGYNQADTKTTVSSSISVNTASGSSAEDASGTITMSNSKVNYDYGEYNEFGKPSSTDTKYEYNAKATLGKGDYTVSGTKYDDNGEAISAGSLKVNSSGTALSQTDYKADGNKSASVTLNNGVAAVSGSDSVSLKSGSYGFAATNDGAIDINGKNFDVSTSGALTLNNGTNNTLTVGTNGTLTNVAQSGEYTNTLTNSYNGLTSKVVNGENSSTVTNNYNGLTTTVKGSGNTVTSSTTYTGIVDRFVDADGTHSVTTNGNGTTFAASGSNGSGSTVINGGTITTGSTTINGSGISIGSGTTIANGAITTNTLNVETINLGKAIYDKNGNPVYDLTINADGSASFAGKNFTVAKNGALTDTVSYTNATSDKYTGTLKTNYSSNTIGNKLQKQDGTTQETTLTTAYGSGSLLHKENGTQTAGVTVAAAGATLAGNTSTYVKANNDGTIDINGKNFDVSTSGALTLNNGTNNTLTVGTNGTLKNVAQSGEYTNTLTNSYNGLTSNAVYGENSSVVTNNYKGLTTTVKGNGNTVTSSTTNTGIVDRFVDADGTHSVTTNGNGTTFAASGNNGSGSTVINGGTITTGSTTITSDSITTKTLNVDKIVLGDKIVDKETGNVIGGELEIGANGSIKIDNANTDAVEFNATKTALSANYGGTSLNMNSKGFNLNNGTGADAASLVLNANGFAFKGSLSLGAGSDVKYTGGNYGTLAKLDATVKDIYDRTDGIYKDSEGNTVISNETGTWNDTTQKTEYNGEGSKVVVGDNGTTFENGAGNGTTNIDGSKITSDANGTISGGSGSSTNSIENPFGSSTSNGEETVYDGENGNTNTVNSSGMTVTNGTSTTVIDAEKVDTTTGNFSNKVTVGSEGNQTVITGGDVTVDNSVTVGGVGGTSIKHDEVRVGADENGQGGSYMNDTDVVSGAGNSLNQTAERVGHLENRVGELEDRIDKVGAMAAAIANLRTMGYDPAAPTEVAVGIGQYRDETGAALGLFHYPNRDFMLSLSVSTSGDEVMGGIGATWKFGRKSPEKVAEIKKAQAEADARRAEEAKLAKAEEMKQAAKEAKIKAQQERHAKLAAERAAQAEAAK